MFKPTGFCYRSLSLCLLLLSLPLSNISWAGQLPAKVFAADPQHLAPSLSPNGKYLAVIVNTRHSRNLVIRTLATQQDTWITQYRDSYLDRVLWASNNRLLMIRTYLGISTELFGIDRDGKNLLNLFEKSTQVKRLQYGHELLSRLPADPDHVLIQYDVNQNQQPDVFKINIHTGRRQLIAANTLGVRYWMTDSQGRLRAGMVQKGNHNSWYYRGPTQTEWTLLNTYNVHNEPLFNIAYIPPDTDNLIVLSRHAYDKAALYHYNAATQAFTGLIKRNHKVDMSAQVQITATHTLMSVGFMEGEPTEIYIDKQWQQHQHDIDQKFKDTKNFFIQIPKKHPLALVWSGSPQSPGFYSLYNLQTATSEILFDAAPYHPTAQMAQVKYVEYTSRDGHPLAAYLTLPNGPKQRRPMVIMPHGGPWQRDVWGYDPTAQFLANRGYVVMQPNFRGSTGYGFQHEKAGYKQWGKIMQDDLSDSVQWAARQGYAKRNKICIYGSSYGGYATLAGLTQTPNLFRCGIANAGLYDLQKFVRGDEKAWFYQRQLAQVGDPIKDAKQLQQHSPIRHLNKLRAPVLVIHSDHDARLPIEHAAELITALQQAKKPYEYMVMGDEGHAQPKEANRLKLYKRLELFLQNHLGTPALQ